MSNNVEPILQVQDLDRLLPLVDAAFQGVHRWGHIQTRCDGGESLRASAVNWHVPSEVEARMTEMVDLDTSRFETSARNF